jgi:hypothetical protein
MTRTLLLTIGLLTGIESLAPQMYAGSPAPLTGGILGQVKNAGGIVQMGATVLLYNRYDQLVRQSLTGEQGRFAFDKLAPDLYSIRVTLASFVPAIRRNISVAAGSENMLQISLANLLSSIDLVSSGPSRGTLMTDDWKWVLRSSQPTRPILRILPVSTSSAPSNSSMFTDTTGVLRLSAGDGQSFGSASAEDLGTAFAVATSVYGTTRLQFSGNVGYIGNSTIPAAGFRTSYSRDPDGVSGNDNSGPVVTLTVRQLYLPSREAMAAGDTGPSLRTMSLEIRDKIDLTDQLHLEYGMSMESITFLQRLNYVSPFARATYDLGRQGSVRFAYSNGAPPTDLTARNSGPESNEALNQDLAALALLPRISLRDDRTQVQRAQTFELGYQRVEGSRTYSAGAYSEAVSNAAFMLSGAPGFVPWTDTLPDLGANDQIFNVGSYHRLGYTASAKQALGDHVTASISAGYTGALATDDRVAEADTAADVRGLIHEVDRPWVTGNVTATLPGTGTRVTSSYGWTDPRALMPDHTFLTQDALQATGWNIRIRQPLPFFSGIAGRLEATGELQNLLAQGYLPLEAAGRKALLTNSPRAIRGGLAFIF